MTIDPSRLLLLLNIRENGSVTRTAQRTGRTPPAVSQQLNRLEEEVGAQLVLRYPQGAHLTPLGGRLAEHAEQISESTTRAHEEVRRHLGQHRNRLRLGAFPTAGLSLLPDALAALRHRRPDTELSVIDLGPAEGITLVAQQRLDLALVGEYGEPLEAPHEVQLVELLDDPMHVVMPADHPRAAQSELGLGDFTGEPWACAPQELPNRRQLDSAATEAGIEPDVPFESESYAVAQGIVSAGVAVAFVPRLALGNAAGTVHRPLSEPDLHRRIHAAIPSDTRHAPLLPVFLRLLHGICAELGD